MSIITLRDPSTGQSQTFGLYDESHCLRLTDLLPDGADYGLLELRAPAPAGGICRLHGVRSTAQLTRKVVLHFLGLLVDELIQTGDHYQLPVQRKARWRIISKGRQAVQSIARRDRYQFVDLDKAQGQIYELVFEFERAGKQQRRIIRIDRARYLQLCALVETGRHYDLS